jgi:hypothetical protein
MSPQAIVVHEMLTRRNSDVLARLAQPERVETDRADFLTLRVGEEGLTTERTGSNSRKRGSGGEGRRRGSSCSRSSSGNGSSSSDSLIILLIFRESALLVVRSDSVTGSLLGRWLLLGLTSRAGARAICLYRCCNFSHLLGDAFLAARHGFLLLQLRE